MYPFRRAFIMALGLLPLAISSCRGDTLPVTPTNILPYLVTATYPEPQGAAYPELGHGVRVALVTDVGGMVRSVASDDLAAIGLSWGDARAKAVANLEGLMRDGTVRMTAFKDGPSGRSFVLVGGHWAAASCILLPGIRTVTGRALDSTVKSR